ncbi:hypothetical protein [Corynebacterium mayonis]|uniref:hypothetical protein n=1 Tax=Corynebacterium mayonis TaxID=3062461 RepID=UPI0031408CEA
MAPARYPLSPSAWGTAVEVGVDKPVQAFLYSDLGASTSMHFIEVALEPDPIENSWRVRYDGGILGVIDAAQRATFPHINRVHETALTPHTMAGIKMDADGRYSATVFLPPAELAVPRNNAATPETVMPPGDMYVVDTSTGEMTAGELNAASPGQWFVTLSVLDGIVVVSLDGRVVGSLSPTESHYLIHAGKNLEAATARAYIIEQMVGLDLAVEGNAERVPALRNAEHADTLTSASKDIEAVTTFPDGSWAVTVAAENAVSGADMSTPRANARRVKGVYDERDELSLRDELGAPQEPSVDFTPTKTWHISAGNYLTEVEKVRLRRQRRREGTAGHHRREGTAGHHRR